jgi:hypothetical protein
MRPSAFSENHRSAWITDHPLVQRVCSSEPNQSFCSAATQTLISPDARALLFEIIAKEIEARVAVVNPSRPERRGEVARVIRRPEPRAQPVIGVAMASA